MQNESEHQFLQRNFQFIKFFKDERLGTKRETRQCSFFFLFEAFSLAASILKYSSTSSTRVSSFFPVTLGVLF